MPQTTSYDEEAVQQVANILNRYQVGPAYISPDYTLQEVAMRGANIGGGDVIPSPEPQLALRTYKVQRGDTLSEIATNFQLTTAQLASVNPDIEDLHDLEVDQIVYIPKEGVTPVAVSARKKETLVAKTSTNPLIIVPVAYTYKSQRYIPGVHTGIDWAAPWGTPVKAAHAGIVDSVKTGSWSGGYGNVITIAAGNGYSTLYGHLSKVVSTLRSGSHVRQGEIIGYVGSSGRSTGPHLHFELRRNGSPINPRL